MNKRMFAEGGRGVVSVIVGILLAGAWNLEAANGAWKTGAVDSNWSNSNNWTTVAGVNGAGYSSTAGTAYFTNAIGTYGDSANPVIVDEIDRNVFRITFDGSAGAYVIGTTNGNTLISDHNGSVTVNSAVANPQVINATLSISLPSSTDGAYSFVNNSATPSATLTIANARNGGTTRAVVFTLDGSNTGANTVRQFSFPNLSTGTAGITKQGAGTWVIPGSNTNFKSGSPMKVNGGTLVIQNTLAFGSASTVTIGGGTLQLDGLSLSQSFALNSGGIRENGSSTANTVTVGTNVATSATLSTTGSGDILTVGNGTNKLSGGASDTVLHVSGPGTVALAYPSSYAGTWSIDAGTLKLGNVTALGSNTSASVAFGASSTGKLQLYGYSITVPGLATDAAPGTPAVENGTSGTATLTINNSASNTFAGVLQDGSAGTLAVTKTGSGTLTLSGANTFGGGLTVSAGTLNLTGANTYSSNTVVNGGTLTANNASGSATGLGSVTVTNGATLGGGNAARTQGFISGAVTIQNGGILAPGNSVGALTVGSLALNAGSVCNFEFNGATPTNDQVVVTTTDGLTINGGTFCLYQEGTVNAWSTEGTYDLISYSGTAPSLDGTWTNSSASNPHVGNRTAGYQYAFDVSGGWLRVTITAAASIGTWTVDSDGNWSLADNWTASAGMMPPQYAGDSATFGTGTVLRTVTLDSNVTVGGIAMNNPNSFVIADAGKTLTMDNVGAGANVIVSAGTVNGIQTAVSLNDSLNIAVSSGKSLAIYGNIGNTSASKALTVSGPGTLALSGSNSYGPSSGATGTTLSGGGTLQLGSGSALGSGDLSITASGTIKAGASVSIGNNIALGSGVVMTGDTSGQNMTLGGVISGSAGVTKVGNGTLTLGGASTYSVGTVIGAGTVSVSSDGAAGGNSGALGVVPASATANNVILNGGCLLGGATVTIHTNRGIGIGPVSGIVGATAYLDAASGQTLSIPGQIASAGNTGVNGLTVNSIAASPGIVVLGGSNLFNGVTVVAGGTLRLANIYALQNSTLNYNNQGGALSFGSLTVAYLGGLTGSQDLYITNTLVVVAGNNGGSQTFSGMLSGGGSFRKNGAGMLTLSNAVYTGTTVIYNGGLTIAGTNALVSHLDISSQEGVGTLVIDRATVISSNCLYITSETGGTGWGYAGNLIVTNGAQVTAYMDGKGRALSYGMRSYGEGGDARPGGNGTLTIGAAGDATTRLTVNGALDMFATSGGGTAGNFTINLNGGTLAVRSFQESTAVNQSGTLKFNGGVLKALMSTNVFIPAAPSQFTTVVQAGGAIIDDAGYSITIAKELNHGAGTPDGGLTKLGAGTLTLSAATNTYNGATTVSNGTLVINGILASTNAALVVSNATLAGMATVNGSLTLLPGARLSPGVAGTGTLALAKSPAAVAGGILVTTASTNGTCGVLQVAGTLSVSDLSLQAQIPAQLPYSVDSLTLATATSVTGKFASVSVPSGWYVKYSDTSITMLRQKGLLLIVQ